MGIPSQQQQPTGTTWETIESVVRTVCLFMPARSKLGLAAKLSGLADEIRQSAGADIDDEPERRSSYVDTEGRPR